MAGVGNVIILPASIDELAEIVRISNVVSTDIHEAFVWELSSLGDRVKINSQCSEVLASGEVSRPLDELATRHREQIAAKSDSSYVSRISLSSIVDYQPENQVVTVQAGISLLSLNEFLAQHGQTIPFRRDHGFFKLFEPSLPNLYKLIESGTPHNLMTQHGTWRDWLLASKLVLADGTIVSSGAAVVKNVTGFDLHKLVVGSRGTLGLLAEVTLKTTPLSSLKNSEVEDSNHAHQNWSMHYHRTLRSDWGELVQWIRKECPTFTLDHGAHQAVYSVNDDSEVPVYMDQVYQDFDNMQRPSIDPMTQRLMKRTKEIFDPTYKLNPGEFGFI